MEIRAAIYPKPNLSKANREHQKYPYLLRNIVIDRCNQVWSTDITYIPMSSGFMYVVAVMDWYSRFILSWEMSNSLETSFCLKALKEALASYHKPDIFNTDQGVQFTSAEFVGQLQASGIQVSMDGKGRATDNIFIERLWRNLKYEDIYLKNYQDGRSLFVGLGEYFQFYNKERPHQHLNNLTPEEVYFQLKEKGVLKKVQNITRN